MMLLGACLAAPLSAQSLDGRFLDGLRERQLFSLAEKFCRDTLARTELSPARRAELTIELSRSLVEEALQSAPEKRDALWQQALVAVDDTVEKFPNNPRLVQVRVQRGLVELAWGEQLAQEAEATGRHAEQVEAAREHLRLAIEELQKSGEKAGDMLRRTPPGRRLEAGELATGELRSLEKNIQYQLARAYRSQGESYPQDSPDRINSLTQAVELLRNLGQGDVADRLTWPSRIDAAVCYRLLGHHEAAGRRLAEIDRDAAPAHVILRARAEQIRLALAEKQINDATSLADANRMVGGRALADLDLAALEAFLAAWHDATDAGRASEAATWQAKGTALVREIDRDHGPYWRRRAESLFAEQVAANPATTDVAVLARAAESYYRAGQQDEALTAYDRAIKQARAARKAEQAFDLGYAAAAIEQERKHFAAAADRFRQAALAEPTLPKAAEAHLLAIYNLGQEARSNPEGLERYVRTLDEHLSTWPRGKSTGKAHLWRARVCEQQRDWQAAIEHYRGIEADSESAAEGVAGLLRCYQAELSARREEGKPTATVATAAISSIEATSGIKQDAPREWSDSQRDAALAIARIYLEYTDNSFAKAEKILSAVIKNDASDALDERDLAAQALLVYALAAQGRNEEATRQAERLADAGPERLQTLVTGLDRLSQTAPQELREKLAELTLSVLNMIGEKASDAGDDQKRALALARARALGFAGKQREAIGELRTLAAAHPRDGQLQEALAQALFDANDAAALAAWQNIEEKSRSGSERWIRAKLHQALLYERRGDKARAVQVVNVVKTLYPAMGSAETRQQFLEILKRCQ